jgi:putative lipoprotein
MFKLKISKKSVKMIMRSPINFNFMIIAFALLLACTHIPIHDDVGAAASQEQDQTDARTYVYECSDGYGFIARHQNGKVWLFLPDKTINLPQVPSGSGAKYRKGQITYWNKGHEALLEVENENYLKCKNNRSKAIWEDAKFRGVDFRAVGNEPGWHLEIIESERVVFVGDYGQERYAFITAAPSIDQKERTTVYTAQNDKHELSVKIVGSRCRDTMSGEAFETTVTVILDGKKYRGCGKALH